MADITTINSNISGSDHLSLALKSAYDRAEQGQHKLPQWLLDLDGMSGKKYRAVINGIVELVSDARYLEIGSWKGSTVCSAIWGNTCRATAIDNWSQFDGPKDEFDQNTAQCVTGAINFNFIESDFRQVDYSQIGKYNVYMFDGPHSDQDQYDGIGLVLPARDIEFILIVDDWNWDGVRSGTLSALNNLNLEIKSYLEIRTTDNNTQPDESQGRQHGDWHNGYYMAVISKK